MFIENNIKALIFRSEFDLIRKWVLDYPDLETGGDFFGFWNKEGHPVVQYVIGSGKMATAETSSFKQDIDYLRKCGLYLYEKFGFEHIGGWHSHNKMPLNNPSSGDVNTMTNSLHPVKLPNFLISICNIEYNSTVLINAFLFSYNNPNHYSPCQWKILEETSPFRETILKDKTNPFLDIHTEVITSNIDNNEDIKKKTTGISVEKPVFPDDSYWETTKGREYLHMVFEKLKKKEELSEVDLLQLADKRIAISFIYDNVVYEIQYPNDYPDSKPELIEKKSSEEDNMVPINIINEEKIKGRRWGRKKIKERAVLKEPPPIKEYIKSLEMLDNNIIIIF